MCPSRCTWSRTWWSSSTAAEAPQRRHSCENAGAALVASRGGFCFCATGSAPGRRRRPRCGCRWPSAAARHCSLLSSPATSLASAATRSARSALTAEAGSCSRLLEDSISVERQAQFAAAELRTQRAVGEQAGAFGKLLRRLGAADPGAVGAVHHPLQLRHAVVRLRRTRSVSAGVSVFAAPGAQPVSEVPCGLSWQGRRPWAPQGGRQRRQRSLPARRPWGVRLALRAWQVGLGLVGGAGRGRLGGQCGIAQRHAGRFAAGAAHALSSADSETASSGARQT